METKERTYKEIALNVFLRIILFGLFALISKSDMVSLSEYTSSLQIMRMSPVEIFLLGISMILIGVFVLYNGTREELDSESFLFHASGAGTTISLVGIILYYFGIKLLVMVLPYL